MSSKLLNWSLTGLLLIALYVIFPYYKGKRDCQKEVEITALKELNAAQAATADIKYITDTKIQIIRERLNKKSPSKKVDSYKTCLLSSNPLQSECLE